MLDGSASFRGRRSLLTFASDLTTIVRAFKGKGRDTDAAALHYAIVHLNARQVRSTSFLLPSPLGSTNVYPIIAMATKAIEQPAGVGFDFSNYARNQFLGERLNGQPKGMSPARPVLVGDARHWACATARSSSMAVMKGSEA